MLQTFVWCDTFKWENHWNLMLMSVSKYPTCELDLADKSATYKSCCEFCMSSHVRKSHQGVDCRQWIWSHSIRIDVLAVSTGSLHKCYWHAQVKLTADSTDDFFKGWLHPKGCIAGKVCTEPGHWLNHLTSGDANLPSLLLQDFLSCYSVIDNFIGRPCYFSTTSYVDVYFLSYFEQRHLRSPILSHHFSVFQIVLFLEKCTTNRLVLSCCFFLWFHACFAFQFYHVIDYLSKFGHPVSPDFRVTKFSTKQLLSAVVLKA